MNKFYVWFLAAAGGGLTTAILISTNAGLLVLLAIVGAWWIWQYPEYSFWTLIVAAPLLPMLKATQTLGELTLLKDMIILVLFVKLFGWPLLTKRLEWRRNILVAPITLLIVWVAINTLRANSLTLGILRAREIVLYVLLYFAVLYLPASEGFLKKTWQWFIASAVVVVLLGVYQWFWAGDSAVLRFDPARSIWIPRMSATLGHPSVLGEYLIVVWTLLLASVLVFGKKLSWWGSVIAMLFLLPFIYLTYSRSVWLGLGTAIAVIAVVWLVKYVRQKRVIRKGYMLAGLTAVIILSAVFMRFTSAGVFLRTAIDPTYGSNQDRIMLVANIIGDTTNGQAIWGKGLGNVVTQQYEGADATAEDIAELDSRTVQLAKASTLVDNQYLKTFAELGLIGILIYLWIYYRIARKCWRVIVGGGAKSQLVIGWWGLGFLAAFVTQALFIDIWDVWPTNAIFWVAAAMVSREVLTK
ncbi:MAG: O-antigen ligase family protein [Candidatus Andersenbacteria bacterium]|nr:O-antigen ligase family protein [bacterium]MDZ4225803.1 O-antigen ligase family protein [Candidatus Andersenbacteria bacterium]